MMRRADGTGTARTLLRSSFSFGQTFQTRDGKWVIARRSFFEAGKGDIYGIREGDSTLVPLVTGPASEVHPAVSPDGRWLAYASDESGTSEIYVRPFPDAASARWQVSTAGGFSPVWSHSGKELFYRSNRRRDHDRRRASGRHVLVRAAEDAVLDRSVRHDQSGAVVRREPGRQALPAAAGDGAERAERADRGAELDARR